MPQFLPILCVARIRSSKFVTNILQLLAQLLAIDHLNTTTFNKIWDSYRNMRQFQFEVNCLRVEQCGVSTCHSNRLGAFL